MNVTHWPLFRLRVRTPRLELRLPTLQELDALAQLSTEGVHPPDRMPFAVPWTDLPPAERARGLMQFHWRQLAVWTPEDWDLQLGVFLDGRIVGVQGIGARDFTILREVGTGSWLGQRHQGQGIGTEMRAAVLELAFTGLGAESAVSAALTDNAASYAVSRKLGYRPNGTARIRVRDALGYERRLELDRTRWEQHRTVSVQIGGLEPCLPLFGL
ncbi:GNAT family N-acetyltransferase [Actinomadura rugatobispora]|uniref:GNAT family N-acetyltransferase n=1 Tax=Actinomadura rugatobispora TaxID=1994 RepID=A0ABW0ZUM8_9ACTN|nr:GNAT family protein [Actinomadura rugatobispora]